MFSSLNYSSSLFSRDPARVNSAICPVPLTKVPDLKEISATGVAIGLWNHVNVPQELWHIKSNMSSWSWNAKTIKLTYLIQNIKNLTINLPVPKLVADNINMCVEKLCYQIEDWVAYHHEMIFFGDGNDFHLYYHIPFFIWYLDGTINYKETARHLLSSLRLSEVEKFKFLCTFCLEDELTKLVPLLFMDNNVVELVEFTSHPLIFYWNHYFRNTLHEIPFRANLTLDNYMFQLERVNNWWAKEYFFDRLNPQDKVQGAVTLIDQFGVWYQKLILMKLNESERVNLYTQKSVKILSNYSKTGICACEILSTWYDVRDLINADQFVSIFDNLLDSHNVNMILPDIWASTSDHFKYYISTYNNHQIIGKIFILQKLSIDINDEDNEFLLAVVSDLNFDVKKTITKMHFFTEYCNKLIEKLKLPIFERLIKKCLPIQELEQFKRNLIFTGSSSVLKICGGHYVNGRVELLNNFFAELFPLRPDLVQEYKKFFFITTNSSVIFAKRLEQVTSVLDIMMADSLLTDDLKRNFKKRLIFSPPSTSTLQSWLVDNRLLQVKQYIDYYLTTDEDKKTLKKRLIIDFENNLVVMFSKYELTEIQHILHWCLEDNQSLLEYKNALQVDAMFNTLLTSAVFLRYDTTRLSACTFRKQFEFGRLEQFLDWYFEFPCRVKEYKLLRINSYSDMPVIKTLLKKKDERHLKIVMKWFFENDQKEIEDFKKKHCKAGKIAYVI